LPDLLRRLHLTLISLNERIIQADLPDNIRLTINNFFADAIMYMVGLTTNFIGYLMNFATRAIEIIVIPVLAYYFLKDWRVIKSFILSRFSSELRPRVYLLIKETSKVISQYIRGQILICIIMGLIVFCGLYIMGVEYPLILGILAAITETIPFLGPILGAVPGIFIAYLISPELTVKVTIFYIIAHQFEKHIIIPNIMGKAINLHPAVIILSLLIGAHLFGVMGMVLAVPVAAVLRVFLKHLWSYEG
jgi:predicted PurR-regulated permease PerM